MKSALILLLAALAVVPLSGAPASSPASAPSGAALFEQVGSDYKKPQEVPDTFFNPFKIQATGSAAPKKGGAAITNELVSDAVGRRGVSGLAYAKTADASHVIIGDQVFGIGDELTFPDGDTGGSVPLVAGAIVVLRQIGAQDLALDLTPEGEATRRINLPLHAFWQP
jgi:hypothetical protein